MFRHFPTPARFRSKFNLRISLTLVISLLAMIFVIAGSAAPPVVQTSNQCLNTPNQVVTDAAGDQNLPHPAQADIRSVSVGEDYQYIGSKRLVFVLKVTNLTTIPANYFWNVRWNFGTPTKNYYVQMGSDANSNVTYAYGTIANNLVTPMGNLESGTYSPDGTITLVIAMSKVGNPAAGANLVGVNGVTQANVQDTLFAGVDSTSSVNYAVRAQPAACIPVTEPTPTPTATPTPTPTPTGLPRFQNFAAPNGMGTSAGEPSIGVNWITGKVFFIANLRTLRITFDDCFSPAKSLWEDKSAVNTSQRTLDPILFTDHMRAPGDNTPNRTIVSQLSGTTSLSSYTDDDGETWIPSEGGSGTAGVDHQTVGGGPFHAPVPGGATYPNAMYYCSQEGLIVAGSGTANCALSVDGGRTYGPSVPIYTVGDGCAPLHGHVKVAPDGTAYVPNQGCGPKKEASVLVSKDNGITWDVKSVPGSSATGYLVDPSVGIASDGTIYLGYQNGDRTPRIAVSTTQGDTWMNNQDVGAQLGIKNSTFPEVVAGDGDRAAFAFLGSTTPGNSNDESYPGIWYLYVATTFNRGASWSVTNVTPNDPVQRGSICNLGTTPCSAPPVGPRTKPDRNLLDFMDITVDKMGRTLVAYPDGCITATCISGGANDFSAKATIARQSGGKRLFSSFDPPDPTLPGAPQVKATRTNNGVHLAWPAPDDGGSPIQKYRVYRRAQADTQRTLLADNVQALSYDDATGVPGTTYFYSVTAVNAVGESQSCGNDEVSAGAATNPCELPGVSLVTDATGDANPPEPALDIQEAFVAEPYEQGQPNKLVWTLKVASLATIPPNHQWYIIWTPSGGLRKYVAAKSDATGALTYEYGEVGSTSVGDPNLNKPMPLGAADAGLVNQMDGYFRITIANSKVGNPSAGSTLLDISPRSFAGGGNVNVVSTSAADLTTVTPAYTLVGNSACVPNHLPNAQLSAAPLQGVAPLVVNFDASGSTDEDAGDSIASYTFDFGDGQMVTQSSPVVSHTYTNVGNYRALLTVQDTRGGQSINVAQAFISVLNATDRINYALAANGGTAFGSSTYVNGGFPASSAIDGDHLGRNWGNNGGWNDGTRDQYPDSLEITFNGGKALDRISVYTLQNDFRNPVEPTADTPADAYGLLDFEVQTWDGSAWVTVPGGAVTANDKAMRSLTFAPITTTRIRVLVTNSRSNWSRIVEVEAFGAP